MWLTEVCHHKSFSMNITPNTLDWIRSCFKTLLNTSTTKHFFTERRQEDNCMWGPDKFGWKSFIVLISFRNDTPSKRLRSEIKKEYIPRYSSSSSNSDSTKKSYAKALSKGSDDDNRKRYKSSSEGSSNKRSSNYNHLAFSLSGNSFDSNVIITRRCLHDDWSRIMFSLKKQSEIEFSYKPFQVDKVILFLAPEHAKLLCSNKNANGWSTVVVKETLEQEKLSDAKIKVRYNYTGFVPANIVISDEFRDNFIINTVQHPEARWLVERSFRVHGSFKTKAAEEFDEHNPLAEAYTYNGFQAILPKSSK
ncbi:hypothetical protein E5676_scaffold901G00060 [Cucumis melo var. makuwa]|uniref:Uncharacterized protein n=1 Tax=Cucumis melo var. makuwa TaxID=1194695 RepID=A0A5D3DTP3_CUCMM|nr:hypothetical protein E6C27_scaffold104G00060 [Cucumis melo var. makuwa]TYK27003.1 hypothetical protein E5676_scaffold901G00060 [Cucumis melo var. makuwa]